MGRQPAMKFPFTNAWHRERIYKKLAELGENSEVVAINLVGFGITGSRYNDKQCPIANYVKTLGYQHAYTISAGVLAYRTTLGKRIVVNNPYPIRNFIHEFDAGRFSYLDQDRA